MSRVRYKTDWEQNPITKKLETTYYKVFQKISEIPQRLSFDDPWEDTPYDEDYVWKTVKREKISKEEYEENT